MNAGTWQFGEEVAARFDTEAHMHIPHYEEVIEKCVEIARTLPQDARIIDVGSATGYTLEKLREAGFGDVWGVDSSKAMLAHSRVKENLIESDVFPAHLGPFDLVLANWTLHFIEDRENYMRDIRSALKPGGTFIITDKMTSSSDVEAQYLDFKRARGLSEEAIAAKAAALEGVLTTRPSEWYVETLEKLGFQPEVLDTSCGFTTILCRTEH
ncbi:MAG: class I SAM-dependent methyltransferase [Minisyncoccota bacterium]